MNIKTAQTDSSGKTHWTKIGTAWVKPDLSGARLVFSALPLATHDEKYGTRTTAQLFSADADKNWDGGKGSAF